MFLRLPLFALLLCFSINSVFISSSAHAVAGDEAGWLEYAHIAGMKPRLVAKLDSGALTSSIHGTKRQSFMRDGERWLRFEFHWYRGKSDEWYGPYTIEAPMERRVLIKDHQDESRRRPVVKLSFSLNNECHEAEFSVVDRSGFNYPILLGRRFLAGELVIDPKHTFTDVSDSKSKSACSKVDDDDIEQKVVSSKKSSKKSKDKKKDKQKDD